MLYRQSALPFSQEYFDRPPCEYRGAPFWSWNTRMTREMIERQILEFKRMGMGGFHVHVRTGLKNEYLSDEFMELIRFCNEKAKENGMLCWLYDEDRYSSGLAGGKVTKNIPYRARWLKLSVSKDKDMLPSFEEFDMRQRRNEKVKGCWLRTYDIVLKDGFIEKARLIDADTMPEGTKWHLYLTLAEESAWCNYQTYVDTLKAEAIKSFIDITHERYLASVGSDFGLSIPAIFTDEPHINGLRLPSRASGRDDICLPYTEELPAFFGTSEGKDLFEAIPYIIWNRRGENACPERYHYYDTLSKLFAKAYCGQIGNWCVSHGLMSTGHLLGEDSVRGQAAAVGDAMRCYREFQLPGIDNLCDNRDFSAAKQATSIARQYGKVGVLSEMYGVTQWDFDFKGYKMAGDWQAALGITVRVPHLAWASMNGEAKRDYPAAIGWQSPWYKDFSYIENHFARLNYCLTRGKAIVHVGVLHPVESFWLLNCAADQSEDIKKQLEDDFQNISEWLLTGGIDFDYVAESSLADESGADSDGKLHCGTMNYEVMLIPSAINLRAVTLEKLTLFAQSGGKLIFVGDLPRFVECRPSTALDKLITESEHLNVSRRALLERLNSWREIDIIEDGKKRTKNLLHQLRADGQERWLFIAQAFNDMRARQEEVWYRRPLHAPQHLTVKIKGHWNVTACDTVNNKTTPLPSVAFGGFTTVQYDLYGNDSLLLRLSPAEECRVSEPPSDRKDLNLKKHALPEPFAYETDEPNVLLLDFFEFALDGGAFEPAQEILKIDNILRERLKWPKRCEALAQPYIRFSEEKRDHILHLRTKFDSEVELTGCFLALEGAAFCKGTLNGQPIDMTPRGFYVDAAIEKVCLPVIRRGENELHLTMRYGDCSDPERMYILGDFGVKVAGARASVLPQPALLGWGNYALQGFPFYTGNMTYLVRLPKESDCQGHGDTILQVPYYAGAAVKARLNDEEEKMLAFLPNKGSFARKRAAENVFRITLLGNRYNGFGQLHMIGDDLVWQGPDSWRTTGTSWTDTYQLKPMGILTAPLIEK